MYEVCESHVKIIADLHFNHEEIIKKAERPFNNVDSMNRGMINKWNGSTAKKDYIYVLGDVGFGEKEELKNLIRQLHGHKYLILGNHDVRNNFKHRNMGDVFQILGFYKVVRIRNLNCLLLHDCESMKDLFNLNLLLGIDFIFAGHNHRNWRIKNFHSEYKDKPIPMINMSCEWWDYKPQKICDLIDKYQYGELEDDESLFKQERKKFNLGF